LSVSVRGTSAQYRLTYRQSGSKATTTEEEAGRKKKKYSLNYKQATKGRKRQRQQCGNNNLARTHT